jgi:peptidoglycan/LPS O-acetylase OafA/YrhL
LGRRDAPAGTRRLDIQALRGIAVLYVVIYHYVIRLIIIYNQ